MKIISKVFLRFGFLESKLNLCKYVGMWTASFHELIDTKPLKSEPKEEIDNIQTLINLCLKNYLFLK